MKEPTNNTPSNSESIFDRMSRSKLDDFHSVEAQRERNADRRKAKEEGKVYDVGLKWKPSDNVEGITEATNDTFGNDEFSLSSSSDVSVDGNTSSGDGDKLVGIEIIWADETEEFISLAEILQDYDYDEYWSAVFAVSANTFTKSVSYDATEALFDDVGPNQTVYRLRIKTLGVDTPQTPVNISALGQYREVILCINGDPVTTLIKTS